VNAFGFDGQTQLLLAKEHERELAAAWRAANGRRGRNGERSGLVWAARRAAGRGLTSLARIVAPGEIVHRSAASGTGNC